MLSRIDVHDMRKRLEVVMSQAGALSLKGAHPSFRDQAALVEIDALDTRFKLQGGTLQEDPMARVSLERRLNRLERRCSSLAGWLEANGLSAELTDSAE